MFTRARWFNKRAYMFVRCNSKTNVASTTETQLSIRKLFIPARGCVEISGPYKYLLPLLTVHRDGRHGAASGRDANCAGDCFRALVFEVFYEND